MLQVLIHSQKPMWLCATHLIKFVCLIFEVFGTDYPTPDEPASATGAGHLRALPGASHLSGLGVVL